jgi:hypothetical protein
LRLIAEEGLNEFPFGRSVRRRLLGALAVLGVVALASVAGCAPAGATVTGKVTLDGAPLEDATICFVPKADGQKQAGWATIGGGEYAIAASGGLGTGAFRVEIRALHATGEKSNDPTLINAKEAVPARYNRQSELAVDLKPGPNVANFDLKTK